MLRTPPRPHRTEPLFPTRRSADLAALTWYGGDRTGDAEPPVEGASINVRERSYEAPDVDGDGEPDAVTNGGDEVIVSGAAGELRLARAGGSVGSPGGQTWLGDLDGDGHDEVIVYEIGRAHV